MSEPSGNPGELKQAVGSDSNDGLGTELTAAYFAGFHKRDCEVRRYRKALEDVRSNAESQLQAMDALGDSPEGYEYKAAVFYRSVAVAALGA